MRKVRVTASSHDLLKSPSFKLSHTELLLTYNCFDYVELVA